MADLSQMSPLTEPVKLLPMDRDVEERLMRGLLDLPQISSKYEPA